MPPLRPVQLKSFAEVEISAPRFPSGDLVASPHQDRRVTARLESPALCGGKIEVVGLYGAAACQGSSIGGVDKPRRRSRHTDGAPAAEQKFTAHTAQQLLPGLHRHHGKDGGRGCQRQ